MKWCEKNKYDVCGIYDTNQEALKKSCSYGLPILTEKEILQRPGIIIVTNEKIYLYVKDKTNNVIIVLRDNDIWDEWDKTEYINSINLDNISLFKQIEIETVNRCNGECSFCPVNRNENQRDYAKMTEKTFYGIIDELSDINYSGSVCFSSNNEPFIDSRIDEFIAISREKLPDAFLYLWTNGSIVTPERFVNVLQYLDRIYVDCYSNDGELIDNIKLICSRLDELDIDYDVYSGLDLKDNKKISIFNRDINQIMSSRGGQAPNKKGMRNIIGRKCIRIFENMVIRPTGEVSLCCCDALGVYTMGNVVTDGVVNVWKKSKEYYDVRMAMQQIGRFNMQLCEECDF